MKKSNTQQQARGHNLNCARRGTKDALAKEVIRGSA